MNYGNAGYHSVQNLLYSRLLSTNLRIRIPKTIILAVVLYGCVLGNYGNKSILDSREIKRRMNSGNACYH
jgi:hypothetical protein